MTGFIKFVMYSVLSAIIFLLVFSMFFGGSGGSEIIYKAQNFISGFQNKLSSSPSLLDLINNPEDYEGNEISYKRVVIKSSSGDYYDLRGGLTGKIYVIKTQEEDGTWISFPVHYSKSLIIYNRYDLTGIVTKHNSGTYYLELTKVVAKG